MVDSETASLVLGHTTDEITKAYYIEKDRTAPDVTQILESFASDQQSAPTAD